MSSRKIKAIVGGLCLIALLYGLLVRSIFSERHLSPPESTYAGSISGVYEVVQTTKYQIPDALRGRRVEFLAEGDGRMHVIGDGGETLALIEGGDGWYFSQDFRPAGSIILPGIARNWNEGRIYATADGAVVDGYMLEKGLMGFILPFKDVARWQIVLKKKA